MPIIFKGSGNKKPKLYEDSFSAYTSTYTYTPKAGYDGFSKVRVWGYDYYNTSGNANYSDVRSGKTFYSRGSSKTGEMPDVTLPKPSVEHSFSSDKKQVTVTVSYTPPSKGYNSTTTTISDTAYINMPSAENQSAVFQTGTVNSANVFSGGTDYVAIYIPGIDGRTLKHLSFVAGGEYQVESLGYTKNGNDLVINAHIYNYGGSSQGDNTMIATTADLSGDIYSYSTLETIDISSDTNIKIVNDGNNYDIRMKNTKYSMFNTYRYLAVYE